MDLLSFSPMGVCFKINIFKGDSVKIFFQKLPPKRFDLNLNLHLIRFDLIKSFNQISLINVFRTTRISLRKQQKCALIMQKSWLAGEAKCCTHAGTYCPTCCTKTSKHVVLPVLFCLMHPIKRNKNLPLWKILAKQLFQES